jgi:hypothetical protein
MSLVSVSGMYGITRSNCVSFFYASGLMIYIIQLGLHAFYQMDDVRVVQHLQDFQFPDLGHMVIHYTLNSELLLAFGD